MLNIRDFLDGVIHRLPFADRSWERVLILGTGQVARRLVAQIESARGPSLTSRIRFVSEEGVSDTGGEIPIGTARGSGDPGGLPVAGRIADLLRIIDEDPPNRIIVALSDRRTRLPMEALLKSRMRGIIVEDAWAAYERVARKVDIETLLPGTFVFSRELTKTLLQDLLRRFVSIGIALAGLILSAPLAAIIAIAIKLDSKGPVFFIQERGGKHCRIFKIYKFRTMQDVAEQDDGTWSRRDSGRITRVGLWLRWTRLDELPQFINVLKGDMDIVGPRPEMASNLPVMTQQIPYYDFRHMVRPGITGWAQIKNGYSVSRDEVIEKMRYDLYYLKHRSLRFDLMILMRTIGVLLFDHPGEKGDNRESTQEETGVPGTIPCAGEGGALAHPGSPESKTSVVSLTGSKSPGRILAGNRRVQEIPPAGGPVTNVLSVDVEEYYHGMEFLAAMRSGGVAALPSRVEENMENLLMLFEERRVRGTFFVVGKVAEEHPMIVRRISSAGHEVACHGYSHTLITNQSPEEFRADLRRAKAVLEDQAGTEILGYRAPNFSIRSGREWAFDILLEEGFRYDSSIYPILHDRYGFPRAPRFPYVILSRDSLSLVEFPIGTVRWMGVNLPIGGGGYFRLLPYRVSRLGILRVNRKERRSVMFYLHPWEIDPGQPRLPMPPHHRFRHFVGLRKQRAKLSRFLADLPFAPAREVLRIDEASPSMHSHRTDPGEMKRDFMRSLGGA